VLEWAAQRSDYHQSDRATVWGMQWLLHIRNGVSWSQVNVADLIAKGYLGWVKFANHQVGWASGTKGEVLMTRDGGKRLNRDYPPKHMLGSEMSTAEMASPNRPSLSLQTLATS